MSNQSIPQRVELLEQMRKQIAEEYNDLTKSNNDIYTQQLKALKEIRNKKLEEVDEWAANEKQSALTISEGEFYQNDQDFEEKEKNLKRKIGDFLAFKQHQLNSKFPNAHKYFLEHGYKSPISFSYIPDPPQFQPPLSVDTLEEHLCSSEEIENDIVTLKKASNYQDQYVPQTILANLRTKDKCILKIKNMPPMVGVLGEIFDDKFEFVVNESIYIITFQSISLGNANLEPLV